MKIFTIGKFDGSIDLYRLLLSASDNNRVSKLCTLLNHNKLITRIKWNKNGSCLASGSNDFNVIIVDFKLLVERFVNATETPNLISNYKHKLVGHRERITGLSWNIHDENLLGSCSYDGTVQVKMKFIILHSFLLIKIKILDLERCRRYTNSEL